MLNFVEAIIDAVTVEECVGQLLAMVQPSKTSITHKLFTVKQDPKESIHVFIIRFRGAALEFGVEESRLKKAFVDALLPQW